MIMTSSTRYFALLATLAFFALPGPADAQMTLLRDERVLHARAEYQGREEEVTLTPDGLGFAFENYIEVTAVLEEPCEPGSSEMCTVGGTQAYVDENSDFYPAGLQFTGVTHGSWGGPPSGSYVVRSHARFVFRIDHPFIYNFNAMVSPPDTPAFGLADGHVLLEGPGGLRYYYLTNGTISDSARLGPGEYVIEGLSWGAASDEAFIGALYFGQWLVRELLVPHVAYQPQDVTVGCGGTATFSVGPSGAPGNFTYQWRRNLLPLANGGRISGATSTSLVITNACDADSGYYDVILNDGAVDEPSRLAHLSILEATGVETTERGPVRLFTLEAAGPNPFQGATSFRYAASGAQRGSIAIYNVAGAKVRTLADGILSGAGAVTWDGRTAGGTRAPAGIYFLRAETESARENRKIVLLK
ncbi:MAG TPA: FlgD immunoglobulin-like domain containing protein [Acidobacteriota bacterium]|nr:FlgD immunoglobulin-like domain containing protein [Acidobacteriota bacterium]